MTEELKPCQCGGVAEYIGREGAGYEVQCTVCKAKGGWGDYGYQAADKWNTRTPIEGGS